MTQATAISITLAVLGAAKLILESFQIDIINDDLTNACTNVVAAGFTIWGIWKNHRKPKEVVINDYRPPIDNNA